MPAMIKTIAIANQKGGVGKTTTCVNLAASLAALRQRVLLVDLDPQGNATMGSGINKHELGATINDALLGEAALEDLITPTPANFDLIPANRDLTIAEINMLQVDEREQCLKRILLGLHENYDYILLDCPPSLNMLTINALVAADGVLIPMQCEYYALEGLTGLMDTIDELRRTVNPQLKVEGLLRTLFDGRNGLANQVSDELLKHFPDQVYQTIIPRNVRLAEAPSHGLPGLLYDRTSVGATAYLALAKEILQRHGKEVVAGESAAPQLLKVRSETTPHPAFGHPQGERGP
jgi:chromosome partitioning protein